MTFTSIGVYIYLFQISLTNFVHIVWHWVGKCSLSSTSCGSHSWHVSVISCLLTAASGYTFTTSLILVLTLCDLKGILGVGHRVMSEAGGHH